MRTPHLTATILAAVAMMTSSSAFAERITLKNKTVIEAQVLASDDYSVTIKRIDGTTLKLQRTQIAEIGQSAPGVMDIQRAEDALKRGDLRAARVLLARALEVGGDAVKVNTVLADISNREREIEMTIHGTRLRDFGTALNKNDFPTAWKYIELMDKEMAPESPLRQDLRDRRIQFFVKRAQSYRDTVDDQAALTDLRAVQELDPTRAQVFFDIGEIYAKNSKTRREAVENFEKGLALGGGELAPERKAAIHFTLGGLYKDSGRVQDAFEQYMLVHEFDRRYEARLEDRIMKAVYESVDARLDADPAAAIALVDRGLAVRKEAELLERKARMLVNMGKYDEGAQAYREVLGINPKFRDANYNLAQLALRNSELFEARALLDNELAINPENYSALCQLGELSLQRDDYEAAQPFFEKAYNVDKEPTRARIGLARTLRLLKNLPEARVHILSLLQLNPLDLDANLEMGRILRAEENFEEAGNYYTNVLTLLEKKGATLDKDLVRLKADALIARGEVRLLTTGPSTANADFNGALVVLPDYPTAFYNIGQAYKAKYGFSKAMGDLQEAEKNLRRARELQPKNPSFALALGILFHQTLAQVDPDKKPEYLANAAKNYKDYITLGGADSATVEQWIKECTS